MRIFAIIILFATLGCGQSNTGKTQTDFQPGKSEEIHFTPLAEEITGLLSSGWHLKECGTFKVNLPELKKYVDCDFSHFTHQELKSFSGIQNAEICIVRAPVDFKDKLGPVPHATGGYPATYFGETDKHKYYLSDEGAPAPEYLNPIKESIINKYDLQDKGWKSCITVFRNPETGMCSLKADTAMIKKSRHIKFKTLWGYDPETEEWVLTASIIEAQKSIYPSDTTSDLEHILDLTDQIGLFYAQFSEDNHYVGVLVYSGPVRPDDLSIGPERYGFIKTGIPYEDHAEATYVPDPKLHCFIKCH